MTAPFRVLLVSTYDLGRQPFAMASAAAWLARDGAEVRSLDLAVEAWDETLVRAADAIAFHVPMHAATRLAVPRLRRIHALKPAVPLACFGLYAPMNAAHLRALGAEAVIGGEFEPALAAWARDARARRDSGAIAEAVPERAAVSLDRIEFLVPDRMSLPPLERYTRLDAGDGRLRVTGYTEASRGCRHSCRHCPVVPVYGGRFRIVPREIVLADVERQVEAGAEHVTFGDPDFLNGPAHALPLVRELHRRHPALTWDATAKVEHLLRHADDLTALRENGCAFMTTAVESVDDRVLARLEKGHTRAGFERLVALARAADLVLHPTFVAFMPWIELDGYLELLDAIERLDLVDHVATVQLAIRLLIPAGSRLLELEEARAIVGQFDAEALAHPWRHADPRVDALQLEVQALAAAAGAAGESRLAAFARIRAVAERAAGRAPSADTRAAATRTPNRAPVPFLTEPWYC